MHAWIFRHRHGLRAVYGLPPEERLAPLLARARSGGDDERPLHDRRLRPQPARATDELIVRVRQLTLRPRPRRA